MSRQLKETKQKEQEFQDDVEIIQTDIAEVGSKNQNKKSNSSQSVYRNDQYQNIQKKYRINFH